MGLKAERWELSWIVKITMQHQHAFAARNCWKPSKFLFSVVCGRANYNSRAFHANAIGRDRIRSTLAPGLHRSV